MKLLLRFLPFFIIIAVGMLPLFGLFHEGLPVTHDGRDHIARIASFYVSLSDGVLIPRWAGNLNWGYGHPILMFLYPFPSYLASAFHYLGFSIIDSVKIVFGVTYLLSGISMYLWVRKLLGEYSGLFAALLYLFAPYRFVNLYVRGAIGEHVAFMFVPFVFLFLTNILLKAPKSRRILYLNFLGCAIATAGLILSHNALSIIFLVFLAVYGLVLFIFNKDILRVVLGGAGVLCGFLLSAFFWVPAYVEGKYTLRDIVTGGEYANRFVDPLRLILPEWNYGISGQFSVQIGIVHIMIMLISFFVVIKLSKKEKLKKGVYSVTVGFFLLSLFMMMRGSDLIWQTVTTLQKFQFPWRFLSLTVLTSSFVGGFAVTALSRKNLLNISFVCLVVALIIFTFPYWMPKGYLYVSDVELKDVYAGTTDTGESAPIWSVRFMEKEAIAPAEIIAGEGVIKDGHSSSNEHAYVVNAETDVVVLENTLYFPGWRLYVDNDVVPTEEIEFQNPQHRGLMTYELPTGSHSVRFEFGNTKVRSLADYLSLVTFISLVGLSFPLLFYKQRHVK